MPVKREQRELAPDPMVWLHLARLSNLSERADADTAQQMKQSVNRIIAILSGEHRQEDEPQSVIILQRVAEALRSYSLDTV